VLRPLQQRRTFFLAFGSGQASFQTTWRVAGVTAGICARRAGSAVDSLSYSCLVLATVVIVVVVLAVSGRPL
jgi:hypothetical protein